MSSITILELLQKKEFLERDINTLLAIFKAETEVDVITIRVDADVITMMDGSKDVFGYNIDINLGM